MQVSATLGTSFNLLAAAHLRRLLALAPGAASSVDARPAISTPFLTFSESGFGSTAGVHLGSFWPSFSLSASFFTSAAGFGLSSTSSGAAQTAPHAKTATTKTIARFHMTFLLLNCRTDWTTGHRRDS